MKFADLTKETVSSTGTGAFITSGAVAGFRTFASGYAVGDPVPYKATQGSNWEIGVGTKSAGGILRTTVKASSNNDQLVNFASGAEVFANVGGDQLKKFELGTSTRVIHASNFLVSDADLSMNSTNFGSNQMVKMQEMLDFNGDNPLVICWDVAVGMDAVSGTEAARIHSNTAIYAPPGCGAIMRPEQLVPMFRNYNPNVNPNTYTDHDITIEGGIWHGNRPNISQKETAVNGGIFTFDFIGVKNLRTIGNIEWRMARAFAFRAANCHNVDLLDFTVDHGAGNTELNTDGVHFNGPCSHIKIKGGRLYNCADDAVSITADDGWGAGGQYGPYGHVYGPITDVTIDDIDVQGSVCGIRLLSGGSRMDRIKISNIKGKTGSYWFVMDNFIPSQTELTGPGNFGSVEIDGVCMENVPVGGGWPKMQAHVNAKAEQFSLRNVTKSKFNNELFPIIQFGEKADVAQVEISKIKSYPFNGGSHLTDQIKLIPGARIGTMLVEGCIFDAPNTVGSPIVIDAGATVETLTLIGNTGKGFTNFLAKNGTVAILNYSPDLNFMASPNELPSWVKQSASPWIINQADPATLLFDGPMTSTVASIKNANPDTFGGNVRLAARLRITGTVGLALHAALFARGVSTVPWSSMQSCYYFDVDMSTGSPGLKIGKRYNGADGDLGSPASVGLALGADYDVKLDVKTASNVTTVSAFAQRVSDSLYLQANGTWAATAAPFRSVVDNTPIPAAGGEYGFYGYCEDDGNISLTNITVTAAP